MQSPARRPGEVMAGWRCDGNRILKRLLWMYWERMLSQLIWESQDLWAWNAWKWPVHIGEGDDMREWGGVIILEAAEIKTKWVWTLGISADACKVSIHLGWNQSKLRHNTIISNNRVWGGADPLTVRLSSKHQQWLCSINRAEQHKRLKRL